MTQARATVNVLLFSFVDDSHAVAVADAARAAGASVAVGNLSTFAEAPLSVVPGEFVDIGGVRVDARSSIWFRRVGVAADLPGMDLQEARLRREELEALVLSGLDAAGPRWVDRPDLVARAEGKLRQLALVRGLGLPVPDTLATSDFARARDFVASGPVLAKAASSGVGLAPFAELVGAAELEAVATCPTLLQRRVNAVADLRVVVVGQQGFLWRRARSPGDALDWRAVDAAGEGFEPAVDQRLVKAAVGVTAELGLSMSVQDWVDDGNQCWFLEVNPVGQWLFLDGADEVVAPAVAKLLMDAAR